MSSLSFQENEPIVLLKVMEFLYRHRLNWNSELLNMIYERILKYKNDQTVFKLPYMEMLFALKRV